MSSHERVENACLIFFDKVIISRVSDKSWKVRACKYHSWNTKWKCHLHIWPDIFISHKTITRPKSSVALRTEEWWSCQDEWPELVAVSGQESFPRCSMHKCAICVMNPSVLNNSAISLYVSVVHWHATIIDFSRVSENWWFIHIVPSTIKIICSLKVLTKIKWLPKFCTISI